MQRKSDLTSAPVLRHADWKKKFRGHLDVSQLAIGGTLTQEVDGNEHAIEYFAKKLSAAQQNYSANDQEKLGLIGFLEHFRCYLEGSEFEIVTDNQVLKYFFSKEKHSRREAGWLSTLTNFRIFPITLQKGSLKGSFHVLDDALSRVHGTEELSLPLSTMSIISVLELDLSTKAQIALDLEIEQVFKPIISKMSAQSP